VEGSDVCRQRTRRTRTSSCGVLKEKGRKTERAGCCCRESMGGSSPARPAGVWLDARLEGTEVDVTHRLHPDVQRLNYVTLGFSYVVPMFRIFMTFMMVSKLPSPPPSSPLA
jgi:hypothetical protein